MTWLRPLPLAALLTPLLGAVAPKGLAPLLFLLGLWAWLAAWRQGRLGEVLALLPRPAGPAECGMPALIPLWALVGWALFACLWSPVPADGLATWLKLAAVAACLPPLLLPVPEEAETVRRALTIGFAAMVAFLAVEVANDLVVHRFIYALQGKVADFARPVLNRRVVALLLVVWPAACVFVLRGKPWLAGGAVAAAILVSLGGVSHSAKLAALLAGLVLLLALALPRVLPAALAAVVVLGVAAAPWLPQRALAPERWAASLEGASYSALHRLYIWEFASRRILERPVAGWGLDASPHLPGGGEKLPQGGNRMNVHPHNGSLQIWLELGGIGAALFAGLMAAPALALRRLARQPAVALGCAQLAAALAIVHLSFGIWQTWWMAGLALAAVLTLAVSRPPPAA